MKWTLDEALGLTRTQLACLAINLDKLYQMEQEAMNTNNPANHNLALNRQLNSVGGIVPEADKIDGGIAYQDALAEKFKQLKAKGQLNGRNIFSALKQ